MCGVGLRGYETNFMQGIDFAIGCRYISKALNGGAVNTDPIGSRT